MTSSETPISTDKYGEKLEYDPEFRGPVKSRSCTDILCLFLFASFLAGWGVVAFFAFREGDPKTLLYPTDSEGNICGFGNLEDKKFLFYFDLLKCASPSVLLKGCPTPQVCVEHCPNETFQAFTVEQNPDALRSKLICKYNVSKTSKDISKLIEDDDCAGIYFKSIPILFRCVPEIFLGSPSGTVKDVNNKTLEDEDGKSVTVDFVQKAIGTLARFLSIREVGEKLFSDFRRSWKYIVAGLAISAIISLIWIVLMRWISGIMVWLSIVIVLVFSVFACYYSTRKYIQLKGVASSSSANFRITLNLKSYLALRDTWLAFAIVAGVVFVILFLVIIFLRKRIKIAIALIKEASKAVGSMLTCLIFPVLPYFLMVAFFAFWVAVALYIASSGKATFIVADAPEGSKYKNESTCNPRTFNATKEGVKCLFSTYGLRDNIYSAHAYNLFGLFWGLFFSVGVGQVSLAGAFAAYYWTLEKRNVPTFVVLTGFYRATRYHLGSVAFGSLLIATIRFFRVMLEYAYYYLNKYDNKVTRFLMWCLRCCFWVLENILKFISKNAYIMVAIYGTNFCSSARRAFMLLMRNIMRVVVIDKITDFLMLLGKLMVVAVTATSSFYFFSSNQKVYKNLPQLHYNLVPPIFITIGSYLIASSFFSVYGTAVDTLFLCFLEDCERNDGSPQKPYFMSKELMKILDKRNKFKDPQSS